MRELTLETILDAMEKNNYKKTTGTYFRVGRVSVNVLPDIDETFSACAIGQAAANLKCSHGDEVYSVLSRYDIDPKNVCEHFNYERHDTLADIIIHLNDNHNMTVKSIAKRARKLIENSSKTP